MTFCGYCGIPLPAADVESGHCHTCGAAVTRTGDVLTPGSDTRHRMQAVSTGMRTATITSPPLARELVARRERGKGRRNLFIGIIVGSLALVFLTIGARLGAKRLGLHPSPTIPFSTATPHPFATRTPRPSKTPVKIDTPVSLTAIPVVPSATPTSTPLPAAPTATAVPITIVPGTIVPATIVPGAIVPITPIP